jgi:hypothetical protein
MQITIFLFCFVARGNFDYASIIIIEGSRKSLASSCLSVGFGHDKNRYLVTSSIQTKQKEEQEAWHEIPKFS